MDSDSFYPAFVTAAKIIGLGEVVLENLQVKGIRLKENEEVPGASNTLQWINKLSNKVKAAITAFHSEGPGLSKSHSLFLTAGGPSFTEIEGEENWKTKLIVAGSGEKEPEGSNLPSGIFAEVDNRITSSPQRITIYDSEKNSSFVQAANNNFAPGTKKRIEVNFGQAIAEWSGAEKYSFETVVNHGLNGTPTSLSILPNGFAIPAVKTSASETQFRFKGFETQATNPPAGFRLTYDWIAYASL